MDSETRLKRLKFRAWHRGTKEADMMLGGYFDAHGATWSESDITWFEALLEEQDVDIMGWAIGSIPVPTTWQCPMMESLMALDFIHVSR
jgi:antitoxin CptB